MKRRSALTATAIAWPVMIAFAAPASAYAYVTQSGRVVCTVTPDPTLGSYDGDLAICQGGFTAAPHGEICVATGGDGSIRWFSANAAYDNPHTQMTYGHTYQWGNWSLSHDSNGTRVTNTRTGHGMFVSIDNVFAF